MNTEKTDTHKLKIQMVITLLIIIIIIINEKINVAFSPKNCKDT